MNIVTVRRITQVFFLLLFLWFAIVASFGTEWWQARGWPVNLFLQLDPLVAISTVLSTHTLYRGLLWALVTIVLTILLGRFFCGWLCPFGTLQQFCGFLGNRGKTLRERVAANRYRKAQRVKYFVLVFFLLMAAIPLTTPVSLQTGLLDPIPLLHRSVNLVVLPIADQFAHTLSLSPRHYDGAWLIGTIFMVALLMNFVIPRFYCRFVCPLGALFGILGRYALWRIAKTQPECINCKVCEKACEGACQPSTQIRISECVLCFNCLHPCPHNLITYRTQESAAGEITAPDLSRRGFLVAAFSGVLAIPMVRLGGQLAANWHHRVIRPPGALPEPEFLKRCLKCGQCMRICPTNVIVPGGLEGGLENLWTPVLNMRIGTSGCQLNCTACGFVCPTSAIRPITLSEKLGLNEFAEVGMIKIGTAFVDRSRCLPWAMDIPCIVCQENCPVTPKAIYVKETYATVREGRFSVSRIDGSVLHLEGTSLVAGQYATGDYYGLFTNTHGKETRRRIAANTETAITLAPQEGEKTTPNKNETIAIQVRLQLPYVDIDKCNGCGICEHECPVSGLRAIRVSAENETRSIHKSLQITRR